jgi:hypothetical protein
MPALGDLIPGFTKAVTNLVDDNEPGHTNSEKL